MKLNFSYLFPTTPHVVIFPHLFIHKNPILSDIFDFFVFFCQSTTLPLILQLQICGFFSLCVCVYVEDSLTSAKTGGGFSFSTLFQCPSVENEHPHSHDPDDFFYLVCYKGFIFHKPFSFGLLNLIFFM
ncbi:hypothetical protein RYX36_002016 [Vicia faba]